MSSTNTSQQASISRMRAIGNSLMKVRGMSIEQVASIANKNADNLDQFFSGQDSAAIPQSITAALNVLGLEGKHLSTKLHRWNLSTPLPLNIGADAVYDHLKPLAVYTKGASAVRISCGNDVAYLIKTTSDACIVLTVKRGFMCHDKVASVLTSMVEAGDHKVSKRVWSILTGATVSQNDFNEIFEGDMRLAGWTNIRSLCAEYNVSPADIRAWVIATHTDSATDATDEAQKISFDMTEEATAEPTIATVDAAPAVKELRIA